MRLYDGIVLLDHRQVDSSVVITRLVAPLLETLFDHSVHRDAANLTWLCLNLILLTTDEIYFLWLGWLI